MTKNDIEHLIKQITLISKNPEATKKFNEILAKHGLLAK